MKIILNNTNDRAFVYASFKVFLAFIKKDESAGSMLIKQQAAFINEDNIYLIAEKLESYFEGITITHTSEGLVIDEVENISQDRLEAILQWFEDHESIAEQCSEILFMLKNVGNQIKAANQKLRDSAKPSEKKDHLKRAVKYYRRNKSFMEGYYNDEKDSEHNRRIKFDLKKKIPSVETKELFKSELIEVLCKELAIDEDLAVYLLAMTQ